MKLRLRGAVRLRFYKKGLFWGEQRGPNLITSAGENLVANFLAGNAPAGIGWLAIGSSAAPPTTGQTALQGTEHQRVPILTQSVVGRVVKLTAEPGQGLGTPQSVGEFGLFNAAVGGVMFSRWVTEIVTLGGVDNYVEVEWSLTIEAGV